MHAQCLCSKVNHREILIPLPVLHMLQNPLQTHHGGDKSHQLQTRQFGQLLKLSAKLFPTGSRQKIQLLLRPLDHCIVELICPQFLSDIVVELIGKVQLQLVCCHQRQPAAFYIGIILTQRKHHIFAVNVIFAQYILYKLRI